MSLLPCDFTSLNESGSASENEAVLVKLDIFIHEPEEPKFTTVIVCKPLPESWPRAIYLSNNKMK